MGILEILTTEDGSPITTEDGSPLEVTPATSNEDIQFFDFSVNLMQALLWQYNEAINLQMLLEGLNAWYDTNQRLFWQNWVQNVFDLRTANEFGLSVWSIILGLPLFINQPSNPGPFFGFDNQTGFNFDNGIFGDQATYQLPLETKRLALRLRYFQLTSSGTVPETNRMLKYLFGNMGNAFLKDFGNMTQRYVFNFPIPYDMQYLFNNYDILPRPAGVASSYVDATIPHFGFAPGDLNFDNGPFGG